VNKVPPCEVLSLPPISAQYRKDTITVSNRYQVLQKRMNLMAKPKIGAIIGSTRAGRFGDKPAEWIAERARATGEFEIELIDLRDYELPFFDEKGSPAYAPSAASNAPRWQEKVASLDGFIIMAAEYNRGPTAVLKN